MEFILKPDELLNPPKLLPKPEQGISLEEAMEIIGGMQEVIRKLDYYEKAVRALYDEKGLTAKQIKKWLKDNGCGSFGLSAIFKLLKESRDKTKDNKNDN